MISFDKFELVNGLKVIVHQDSSTPMAVFNIMYDVGARDENPNKTGFAHLFEHLMFGGSANAPHYDVLVQLAGGENNAFTTNDMTNYYIQLPAQNLETAFWIESDRMFQLSINEKSLNVQRKVVIEEFKEHYITRPYGDVWHKMRDLCYQVHPYKWMTIGKELSHIEQANLEDVLAFYKKFYCPANAILVVSGNVTTERVKQLCDKWFADIPSGEKPPKDFLKEPTQIAARQLTVTADVPFDALYKCWHICDRQNPAYHTMDIITDYLGSGESSVLYQTLVKEKELFSNISCYHWGSIDGGLLTIEGHLLKGVEMQKAEDALNEVLAELQAKTISENDLQKSKNKIESSIEFEDISLMYRSVNLAWYELLGDAALINTEEEKYNQVTTEQMLQLSKTIFRNENCNTIYYYAKI